MLGFVILSHNRPHQLLRLTRTLGRMFANPPIVCHHDVSQSAIDTARFPANVTFVEPAIRTGWAKWSLVEASLAGIRILYEKASPDWFSLLSAADYPIMPASSVIAELDATTTDVFIDYRPVPKAGTATPPPGAVEWLSHHGNDMNIELARNRYRRMLVKLPVVRTRPPTYSTTVQKWWRLGRQSIALPFEAMRSPFSTSLDCYVGSQWFTANRRAAELLLEPDPTFQSLRRYFKDRIIPDEAFFQSLFCNSPALRIDPNPRRYAYWADGEAHPRDICRSTLHDALKTNAHFARKFAPDDPVLDELDRALLA